MKIAVGYISPFAAPRLSVPAVKIQHLYRLALALFSVHAIAAAASPEPGYDPIDHWELEVDTSALWSVGDGASPLSYTFLPQMIALKTHHVFKMPVAGGDLTLRNRFSFLGEPILNGPESYFIGLGAGGSLEWWTATRAFCTFLSAGGGVGWMDARGYEIPGGQGQDFNLHWYLHGGLRWMLADRLSATAGVYFQHVSNAGQDKVNPGVNALGPTLGLAWHF